MVTNGLVSHAHADVRKGKKTNRKRNDNSDSNEWDTLKSNYER